QRLRRAAGSGEGGTASKTSATRTGTRLPDQREAAAPARACEQVRDLAPDRLELIDPAQVDVVRPLHVRPPDKEGAPLDQLAGDEAPHAGVGRPVAVVPHHEVAVRGDGRRGEVVAAAPVGGVDVRLLLPLAVEEHVAGPYLDRVARKADD